MKDKELRKRINGDGREFCDAQHVFLYSFCDRRHQESLLEQVSRIERTQDLLMRHLGLGRVRTEAKVEIKKIKKSK